MKKYILRTDEIFDEENKPHTVYGVDVPTEQISIPDIFCDRARAENLINTCNKLDLSPVHIFDVIEDALE